MPAFDLYSRRGCHLCELMLEALLPLVKGRADLNVHDIDSNPDWIKRYDFSVPVLEFEGQRICHYHLDRDAVRKVLAGFANKHP